MQALVQAANRSFSPSPEAVDDARRIVAVFSEAQHAASNVVNLDGRMVERLHYEKSLQILATHARACGELVSSAIDPR